MISAVVVVPGPPLLLPIYTGRIDAGAAVQAAATEAVGAALADSPDLVVVVAGTDGREHPADGRDPLGFRVAQVLLGDWTGPVIELGVPTDGEPEDTAGCAQAVVKLAEPAPSVVIVVADGSARRGLKAPGHLDDRAFALDDTIAAALATADRDALAGLDRQLCTDLMVAGRAPLQVLAAATAQQRWAADLRYRDDPFGVSYFVAIWRPEQ